MLEDKITETIDIHRKMLLMSKNVSDFQVENLKKWVLFFIDKENGLNNYKIKYNFVKNREFFEGEVVFELILSSPQDTLNNNLKNIESSVKFLFWDGTKVKFKVNRKLWKLKK